MVDNVLLEQVLRLDDDSRREFVRAVQASLESAEPIEAIPDEVRNRLSVLGERPATEYVTLEEDEREVRARRYRAA